jgi:uncharacterized membrane protein
VSAEPNHHRWTRWQLFAIILGIWVLVALLFLVLVRI